MAFFKAKENNNDKMLEVINNVQNSVEVLKNNDIAKLKSDVDTNDIKQTKEISYLKDEIEKMKLILQMYEDNFNKALTGELKDNQEVNEFINFTDICKKIKIVGINSATLKYYLYLKGLYEMNINPAKNSFSLNVGYCIENSEFKDILHIENDNLFFKEGFIDYCKNNEKDINKAISDYSEKQKQYKISKKKLESVNVKNYEKEIKNICGIRDSYDSEKWAAIYGVFEKSYPSFTKDYYKYKDKYILENPKEKYPISKVAYVVSVMQEGNFLLKIACDIYVQAKTVKSV